MATFQERARKFKITYDSFTKDYGYLDNSIFKFQLNRLNWYVLNCIFAYYKAYCSEVDKDFLYEVYQIILTKSRLFNLEPGILSAIPDISKRHHIRSSSNTRAMNCSDHRFGTLKTKVFFIKIPEFKVNIV